MTMLGPPTSPPTQLRSQVSSSGRTISGIVCSARVTDRPTVPHHREEFALQNLTRLHPHTAFDEVRPTCRLVTCPSGHVVYGNGRPASVTLIRRAAVPREAVMEHHLSGPHLARNDLDALAVRQQR